MYDQDKQLPEVFADGVSQVSFSEVFRIMLAGINPQQGGAADDGIPLSPKMTVLMPMNGFLQAYKAMGDVIKQMVEAGVIDPNALENAGGTQVAQSGNGTVSNFQAKKGPSSSNFS